MSTEQIIWNGEIGCEGGPVLVANLEDFNQWCGSEPFAAAAATELHFWSPFTAQLPAAWQPNGPTGHQYLASADVSAARERLMSVLLAQWPGTTVDRSQETWRATLPDGRTLSAALYPDSEYDRATRDLGADAIHRFGIDACTYLWSAAPGMVRIALPTSRDVLLLSQVEFCDDEEAFQTAHSYAQQADRNHADATQQVKVTAGPVVVAWSPNSASDLPAPLDPAVVGPALPGVLLDFSTDASGALLWLDPGLYESTLHYHEQDGWAVSWCRLRRIGR